VFEGKSGLLAWSDRGRRGGDEGLRGRHNRRSVLIVVIGAASLKVLIAAISVLRFVAKLFDFCKLVDAQRD
jgi:hypothetical protein